MNRTKSALSLRNLANSIKQSISNEVHKTTKKQINLLKTSRTSLNLNLKEEKKYQYASQMTTNNEQKENRRFVLEKQISNLQKNISNSKSHIKNYTEELNQYEQLSTNIKSKELQSQQQKNNIKLYRNRIMMLQEDIFSTKFNEQQRIAEKQYLQIVLQTYQRQFQGQAQFIMNSIGLQNDNQRILKEIREIDQKISVANGELTLWKEQNQFSLKQHQLKNNLKLIRVQLFQIEDRCNTFCNQNHLKSLRELYCLYYKIYARRNGLGNSQSQNGLDIFICKYGLVQDFSQFIRERLVYNHSKCKDIENYLSTLTKMEHAYKKKNIQPLKKLHSLFQSDLTSLKAKKNEKQSQIKSNQTKIKDYQDKIDNLFNNESLAIIQFLRQKNNNKYDIKEIKLKLKQQKKEQKQRINQIRKISKQIQSYQQIISKYNDHSININREDITQLSEEILKSQVKLEQITDKINKFLLKKEDLEQYISNGVSKWKESDDNKKQLQKLYIQLNRIKEEGQFKFTKNKIDSITMNTRKEDRHFSNRYQQQQTKSLKNHSKQNSVASLHQNKSLLSLVNPYKRTVNQSHQFEYFQPMISDCRMILSKKMSSRDLDRETTNKQGGHILQSRFQNNVFLKKAEKMDKNTEKENKNISSKTTQYDYKPKISLSSNKTIISQDLTSKKGKLIQSQRISLSNLLISKFNR